MFFKNVFLLLFQENLGVLKTNPVFLFLKDVVTQCES